MAQFTHSLCEEVIRTDGKCGLTRNEMVQLARIALRVLRPAGATEAVKLAEQWKERADDAGRLSRAVLGGDPR